MKLALAFVLLSLALPAAAADRCEIPGEAIHWAYDACMGRFETDDGLHPGVAACADRNQRLIAAVGTCRAKRILKGRMCEALQRTEFRRSSYRACMRDTSVVGSTVANGGL